MSSKILHIQGKQRPDLLSIVKLQDFDYIEGEDIESKTILEKSNISLYCLDLQNQKAIFVETPSNIFLADASFVHQTQYEYAQKLIAVPFQDLFQLAEAWESPIKQLVIVYSVGRCGSTLLSKVFNQVDSVVSLSEPDFFSQIVAIRNTDGSNDQEITQLLKICIVLLGKTTLKGESSCLIIKLRSFCIELGDLIYKAYPDAKVLFLYRNLEDVVKSSIRAFVFLSTMLPTIAQNIDVYSKFIPLLKDYANYIDFNDPNAIDVYTASWLSVMQRYLLLRQQGITICALRYEDLLANPHQMVTSIFKYCDLPTDEVHQACEAFKTDAHSNSNLSWKKINNNGVEIPDASKIRQKIEKLLNRHPEIKQSNFIVPGTLLLAND
ncbi:sulfotransferase [Acaryochloris sp. IP29b_bin.137]|uniref:sulfotransferase family protein n=1 Tax=Acaryochloris sp. IP29b_bin.137 TaxID=2969217 RepID=UPI00262DC053|nr:sulfotransferase [Acaryochloris sp. IP29b_bin.137]